MNFLFSARVFIFCSFSFDQVKDKDFEVHDRLILNYFAHYRIDDLRLSQIDVCLILPFNEF